MKRSVVTDLLCSHYQYSSSAARCGLPAALFLKLTQEQALLSALWSQLAGQSTPPADTSG